MSYRRLVDRLASLFASRTEAKPETTASILEGLGIDDLDDLDDFEEGASFDDYARVAHEVVGDVDLATMTELVDGYRETGESDEQFRARLDGVLAEIERQLRLPSPDQ